MTPHRPFHTRPLTVRRFQAARRRQLLFLFLFLLVPLSAAPRPSYPEVTQQLPALWQKRHPLKHVQFLPNPDGRGILRVRHTGRRVYYYHFTAILPRPRRAADGQIDYTETRKIELWVRYRSWLEAPYDLTFAREDLLPGRKRRWLAK